MINRTSELPFRFCRAIWQQVQGGLESQQQTVKALKERIVQLPRDACALVDAFVEASVVLACDLADAGTIGPPHQAKERRDDERLEPARLVIRRRDREFQCRAHLVPHAAIVARHDAEPVGGGPKIGIEGLAPGADILPLGITAFEHDTKVVLLGRDQAERGVVDLQVSDKRGQPHSGRRVVGAAIGDELFDVHWWR